MRPTDVPPYPSDAPARPAALPPWPATLRALREARGVTQDGWAALLGVSRTTVQRWEGGARAPDPGAEAALLRYCREAGLFRAFARGPLAGLTLTEADLRDLLAEARWGGPGAGRSATATTTRRADGGGGCAAARERGAARTARRRTTADSRGAAGAGVSGGPAPCAGARRRTGGPAR
jgi:transcriptional regulator with XRE-family HTH domain